jgi:aminopeptidase N
MSVLPAFAAALALESSAGAQVRQKIIRRALAQIPAPAAPESNNDPAVTRAKSLLLFYALSDRVGADPFQKALRHMLYARRQRGFDLSDLISAVEEESHQDIGPFVRQWIKRPGVPDDFRATYSQSTATQETTAQEATP